MPPVRVLLVDDDPLVRSGLRYLIDSAPDIEVVGETGDGEGVVGAVRSTAPDLVLMDLRMARMDGVRATAAVRALDDPPEVLVLTTWDVDEAVVRSIEAGASGFLLKGAPPSDILQAIRSVAAGDAVMSPRSTRQLLNHVANDAASARRQVARDAAARLTEREREVAVLVGEGLSNAEIGKRLYLSEGTVKTHVAAMLLKLEASTRVGIAVVMERAGLLGA